MEWAAWLWTGFSGLTGLVWLARHFMFSRVNRAMPTLRGDSAAGEADGLPSVTVIVAAKDEQQNIERCVRSLLAQRYPALNVVAVNDRSTDATGEILDQLAAEDGRLTVVHVRALRPGWFGKNNAMREGVARAAGQWLCFTDADCVFSSAHAVATVMRYALQHRADFVSALPVLETHGLLEQMVQPACGGILLIWFNPLYVNNPRRRAAYANGAFMLMTRAAYERIGGHEPVRTEVNEDVHLARRAKEAGLRLRVVGNDDLYRVRMYTTFGQMWNGWSRIFYGCFGSVRRLLLSMTLVLLVGIQPWFTLAAGAALCHWAGPLWRPVFWAGLAASLLQLSVMMRYYRASRIPIWLAPTYPLAAGLALGMLASAIRRTRGRATTTWRGTTYRGDAVVAEAVAGGKTGGDADDCGVVQRGVPP